MLQKLLVKNEGALDRGVRIVVGLVLLSLALFGPKTAWGFVGVIPLLTGALGSCPLYTLVGLSTCPLNKS